MYILITGDRKWRRIEPVYDVLLNLSVLYPGFELVQGYAEGADEIAHFIALEMGIKSHPCPAHWNHNTPRWVEIYGQCQLDCEEMCGPSAGSRRNRYMIKKYLIELVVGFHENIWSSKGTKDMLTVATTSNIPTWLHDGKKLYIPMSMECIRK